MASRGRIKREIVAMEGEMKPKTISLCSGIDFVTRSGDVSHHDSSVTSQNCFWLFLILGPEKRGEIFFSRAISITLKSKREPDPMSYAGLSETW